MNTNRIIRIYDRAGVTLGWLTMPPTIRVIDLQSHLRALGVAKMEFVA